MGGTIFRGLLAVVLLVLVAPAPALAHNSLTGSSPKNRATVAEPPASVRLTFLSKLSPKSTKVTVTGPDGASAAAGAPTFAGSRVTVRLRPGPAGSYTVAYQVPSGDGHTIKGKVVFTAREGNAPTPTATPPPSPTPSAAPAAVPSPAAAPATEPADGDGNGALWWLLAAAALLATLVTGVFLRSRRRA